nr:hypothetical protein BaRGS_027422 [Batillaria attramentaria]
MGDDVKTNSVCRMMSGVTTFPAKSYPDLRSLDASSSGMSLNDLSENGYLVLIFNTVRKNSITKSNQDNQDATIARRLTTIVLSDFLCWFPIGLLGLLASTGTPISSEVNIGMAIFVLPFNSALNPFLYTFNVFMEKRRKAAEARLLQQLIRKAGTLAMDKDQAKRRAMTCSTQTQTDTSE